MPHKRTCDVPYTKALYMHQWTTTIKQLSYIKQLTRSLTTNIIYICCIYLPTTVKIDNTIQIFKVIIVDILIAILFYQEVLFPLSVA